MFVYIFIYTNISICGYRLCLSNFTWSILLNKFFNMHKATSDSAEYLTTFFTFFLTFQVIVFCMFSRPPPAVF